MDDSIDIGCSVFLATGIALALGSHAVATAAGRLFVSQRVEREEPLPLVGRGPMLAVYRVLVPFGRMLAAARVSADAVTATSLVLATFAAIAFAFGSFGIGALIGCFAALADAVDGIVARESNTSTRVGQVLDTLADRYVDALLLGGLAVYVRHDAVMLIITLGAIVGSFMVSYASSIERELGHTTEGGAVPMRRPHRLAYLITGAALGPLVGYASGREASTVPILVAALAIALVGNYSAVRRIVSVGRAAPPRPAPAPPDSAPREVERGAPLSEGARR